MVRLNKKIYKTVTLAVLVLCLVCAYNYRSEGGSILNTRLARPLSFKFSHQSDLTREEIVNANYDQLQSILNEKIDEPRVANLVHSTDSGSGALANATLLIMAKNSDIKGVIHTMKQIEKSFNKKFRYPYVFLNDGTFSESFKARILAITEATCYFERIEPDIWNQPDWIDRDLQKSKMKSLQDENIAYASKMSYHNMCRYYSMGFYNHPRLQQFKYYWRFEPNTDYFCDIDYDVFKFMESNNKVYGFVISLYDAQQTVETLWAETLNFLRDNPHSVSANPAIDFVTENLQNPDKTEYTGGYSTCHFWSNFEIADMDFYRSSPYNDWVNHLDRAGGFYYERWGDAPVHSLGLALFANKNDIHWFRDIGYKHHPYTNCPNSDRCSRCTPADFTYAHLKDQNCITNWWNYEMDTLARNSY